jgi:hypothetical protein
MSNHALRASHGAGEQGCELLSRHGAGLAGFAKRGHEIVVTAVGVVKEQC